ncbi:putative ankyrin repeat protein [Phaeoacremonium minimum UCRPA7]|uniref:Putative ankyrin repeat protein n=1 Tax=Phaeoacremonium minimum (strain UCR-PA7) TaxID=1286976 RepID=R8BEH8_PHAM7|nr:putative ankyrin repeat protein [Phaeoacremonium minimum UCRPA7]EON97714.1 putative ankyrin repeat protein [Phaeoacremonium minimum UCRPA7]
MDFAELQALSRLPASREDLIDLFGNVVAADKFFSIQGCFCVIVLRKGEEVCISDASTRRLPYLEEQPLNKGAYGKVSRVVVAKGHFFDPKPVTEGFEYNVRDLEMARKDYEINNKNFPRAGQEEREIMDKILGGSLRSGRCENIVDNWGSLEIAPDTYSLFMPKAICDLRAYMTEHHALPPATSGAKAEFIACAAGLASGLAFLHGGMKTQEFEDMVCYHMDLKPDNVLIFHEGGRYVWKLSDFGMARVKIRRRGPGGYERERDFNSWFRRRWHQQQPADPSLSATVNRRAEGTYQPPESVSQERKMTTKSDVWSLGEDVARWARKWTFGN